METKGRYTLEHAQAEAEQLQEKITRREAKDLKDAELQIEAERIIQNPEEIIRNFTESDLGDPRQQEGWEDRLQRNLKNRLAGQPDKRYIVGLSQAAKGMSPKKESIVTAAYVYELEHRDEMPNVPNYNPTVLFRLTLDFAKRRADLLGATMEKYLERVPLDGIYKYFRGMKTATHEDLPNLSELALRRLSKEEESARLVLGDAKVDLFRPSVNAKNKKLRADSFFMRVGNYDFNAERFTPQVLDYLLANVKGEEPAVFDAVVQKIYDELIRLAEQKIPLDEREYTDEWNKIPHGEWSKKDYFKRAHYTLVTFRRLIDSMPVLKKGFAEVVEKKKAENANQLQIQYAGLIEHGAITQLKNLVESTGVTIEPQIVQQGYSALVRSGNVSEMYGVEYLTRIKPVLEPDTVREGYTAILKRYRNYNDSAVIRVRDLISLRESTGVAIDPQLVQEGYAALIEYGESDFISSLADLMKITGIEFDSNVVHGGYGSLTRKGKIDQLLKLKEVTGVEIAIESRDAQKGYEVFLRLSTNRDKGIDFDNIKRLKEITGEEMRGDIVQRKYAELIKRWRDERALAELAQLREITGIEMEPGTFTIGFKEAWEHQSRQDVIEILQKFPEVTIVWQELNPRIDTDIYESARRIANKDLFEKTWEVLTGHVVEIPKEPEKSRQSRSPEVPAHIHALLEIRTLDLDKLLSSLNAVFADARARRSGARELAAKAEFAITHITALATDKEIRRVKKSLIQTLEFNPDKALVVRILDALASLIALYEALAEYDAEERGGPVLALRLGMHL